MKPIVVQPAKFGRLPLGWWGFDRDFGLLTRSGADVNSYALSWAYKPGPFGWASALPRNALGVSVILIRRGPDGAKINLCRSTPHLADSRPVHRLPLRLPKTTTDRLEGAPNVLEYRVFGRIDDSYNIDLRVDINNRQPTAAMLRTAQAVVNGIRFPRWPRLTRC